MSERRWVKLWRDWFTSTSHRKVGPEPLLVGVALMTFVRWEPGQDDAWAVYEGGDPVSIDVIAELAQVGPKRCDAALKILAGRGTVARREDGAWGFPKFGRWQETARAAQLRRAAKTSPKSDAKTSHTFSREGEAEGEGEVKTEPSVPSPTCQLDEIKPGNWNATARRIWEAHEAMRVRHGIGRHRGFVPSARETGTPAIRRLVEHVRKREQCDEEAAIGHVLAKLERGCQDCAAGRIDRAWVNGPTAWRTSSYDAATDSAAKPAPKLDLHEQYQAELARLREGAA